MGCIFILMLITFVSISAVYTHDKEKRRIEAEQKEKIDDYSNYFLRHK